MNLFKIFDSLRFIITYYFSENNTFNNIVYIVNGLYTSHAVNRLNEGLYKTVPRTIRYSFKAYI